MPMSELTALVAGAALGGPFSEAFKLLVETVKNVKDFRPLFEDLLSTMARRLPILQEIHFLQEGLDPTGNDELYFLMQTMQRALELACKCSCVRRYSVAEKAVYAREINGINEDLVKFCQVDLPLIQHRNHSRLSSFLQSRLSLTSLNIEQESPPPPRRLEEGNSSISLLDEDEQRIIWESYKEDEQLAAGVQESLIIEESRPLLEEGNSSISTGASSLDEDEQRIIWESLKEKCNGRQVKEDEQLAAGVQESLIIEESRPRLEEGNSSISTRASSLDEDEQRIIWESLKEKGNGKQVKEDEQFAAVGAPFSEILKLLISLVKKVKDFKPLFEDLVSTMERRLPILQEINILQEGLDPAGNGELNFLMKTMQRAVDLACKCSCVRWYSVADRAHYTREIKEISKDFLRFCQVDLTLLQHRNQLLSRLNTEEGNSSIGNGRQVQKFKQVAALIHENVIIEKNGKQVKEDEQFAAALQESLLFH